MKGDFHIHTVHSDGHHTVSEILKFTKDYNYIAITDHDTFAGAKEATALSSDKPRVVYGIELSTDYNGESVHLLGYFSDFRNTHILDERLLLQQKNRIKRAYQIREKLRKLFDVDFDFSELKNTVSITRGSIASAIIAKGYPYSRLELFDKMIGVGRPAYIPSTKLTTAAGINLIKKSNGLVFLAHPVLLKKTDPIDIIALGIDGIEAIYPANNKGDEDKYRRMATQNNLLISAGTDFHFFNDGMHGNIGDVILTGDELERFVAKMDAIR